MNAQQYIMFNSENLPVAEKHFDFAELIEPLGAANRAVAKYAGLLSALENPKLLLSPFFRDESVSSNRIEGTRVDTLGVLRAEAGDLVRDTASQRDLQEIRNYRDTLIYAVEEMERRPFSLDFLCGLHALLLRNVRGNDKVPGKFREVQNFYRKTQKKLDENFRAKHVLKIFDAIVEHPIFRLSTIEPKAEMSRPMLSRIVARFEDLGIVRCTERGSGRSGSLYVCAPLVNIPEQKKLF